MDTETYLIMNGVLSFGAPLLWALRELLVLRRGRDGGSWGGGPAPDPTPPPPPAPAGSRPLPDCLIPKRLPPLAPAPGRRVLEDA